MKFANSTFILIAIAALLFIITTDVNVYGVSGHSMEPLITDSDVVFIKPVTDPLTTGDIITFRTSDKIKVTHRIVGITNDGYITKGDNNPKNDDALVPKNIIIGKLWFKIPYIGGIFDFASTQSGYILLTLIPAILLITIETRKILTYINR
ncbi:MAG: signal peptidase I [Methanosarcinales archaeon]|nr:signal peptidase I [Methanosarcinales archaeon]